MDKYKISVIMAVYNAEKYLDDSIKSIVDQTYKNFELIIVNDFSTDKSKNIIDCWSQKDPRIISVTNKYQKGIAGASNTALELANGDFIAKADADDVQKKYRLSVQIDFLNKNKNIDILGGGYQLFGKNLTKNKKIFHPQNSTKLAWKMLTDLYFCNPSVMMRKSVLIDISNYPYVDCEDFAFLSIAIKKHCGKNLNKILLDYRQHDHNYSNDKKNEIKSSVLSISKDNFFYYTNTFNLFEEFYEFHANKQLKIKNLFPVLNISVKIASKISKQYNKKLSSLRFIYLIIIIKKEILFSLIKYYSKKIFNFLYKS